MDTTAGPCCCYWHPATTTIRAPPASDCPCEKYRRDLSRRRTDRHSFATWREVPVPMRSAIETLHEPCSSALHAEGLAPTHSVGWRISTSTERRTVGSIAIGPIVLLGLLQDQSPEYLHGLDTIKENRRGVFLPDKQTEHIPRVSLDDGQGMKHIVLSWVGPRWEFERRTRMRQLHRMLSWKNGPTRYLAPQPIKIDQGLAFRSVLEELCRDLGMYLVPFPGGARITHSKMERRVRLVGETQDMDVVRQAHALARVRRCFEAASRRDPAESDLGTEVPRPTVAWPPHRLRSHK